MAKAQRRSPASDNDSDVWLSVEGYKAVRRRQELRIAPLTIIAGVNSSGKSSFIQPFLLMKQTLDSAFDPGPLLLHGANVKVTEYAQMFSRGKAKSDAVDKFTVGFVRGGDRREITFGTNSAGNLRIARDVRSEGDGVIELSDPLSPAQRKRLKKRFASLAVNYSRLIRSNRRAGGEDKPVEVDLDWEPKVSRNRCFLESSLEISQDRAIGTYRFELTTDDDDQWVDFLRGIIHVPGLRGNPERSYQRSAVGATYPGTFDTYVANIIFEWSERSSPLLERLAKDLERLGLTWKVVARRVNDASIELLVGRMPHAQQGGAFDLVSVADVGFGVSQTLPVLVALLVAKRGQVVYVEQPEIHLHPRAQLALADALVAAAQRGVIVVAETHSSLVIRGIQTAVARGEIDPTQLSLNWFGREEDDGSQKIDVAELDEAGRFGDWPVDFDDIARDADWAYLDAIEVIEI